MPGPPATQILSGSALPRTSRSKLTTDRSAPSRAQFDPLRTLDAIVSAWRAGQYDHLSALPQGIEHRRHLDQPLRIREAERVVDQDRDRVLLGDQGRAGQPSQDAELLLGPTG